MQQPPPVLLLVPIGAARQRSSTATLAALRRNRDWPEAVGLLSSYIPYLLVLLALHRRRVCPAAAPPDGPQHSTPLNAVSWQPIHAQVNQVGEHGGISGRLKRRRSRAKVRLARARVAGVPALQKLAIL